MNQFMVTNWSQYAKASEHLGYFSSLDSAIGYCKHQTPHGADAQSWEEYSEVTEVDEHGKPVESYYFVTN